MLFFCTALVNKDLNCITSSYDTSMSISAFKYVKLWQLYFTFCAILFTKYIRYWNLYVAYSHSMQRETHFLVNNRSSMLDGTGHEWSLLCPLRWPKGWECKAESSQWCHQVHSGTHSQLKEYGCVYQVGLYSIHIAEIQRYSEIYI